MYNKENMDDFFIQKKIIHFCFCLRVYMCRCGLMKYRYICTKEFLNKNITKQNIEKLQDIEEQEIIWSINNFFRFKFKVS